MTKLIAFSLFTLFTCLCSAQTITTIAGNGFQGYGGDGGPATSAELNNDFGIFTLPSGVLYIADNSNHRAREVSSGTITTFAGNGISGYTGNGGFATAAELGNPADVVVDAAGNIYVVDFGFPSVREVHTGGKITTFAGIGSSGYTGDGGPASLAELNNPCGLAIDDSGKIYISDRGNNRIRVVDTAGTITTYAGNGVGGYSGDGGQAGLAEIYEPNGIFVDIPGNLYIADYENNRVRIVSPAGIINTFAGNGTASYSGDEGPATDAELYSPMAVAVDTYQNVYIADHNNSRVRLVNVSGTISTVAGNGVPSYYGDGGPATDAEINYLTGVCLDGSGNLYISDAGNSRIREVTGLTTQTAELSMVSYQWSVYPNPSTGIFTIAPVVTKKISPATIEVFNVLGEKVFSSFNIQHSIFSIDLRNQQSGVYFYRVVGEEGGVNVEGKLVIER